ncbi:type VI secretion system baseplate subunit TssG [Janthinobacterium agaricidamnosum]|uniref:Type VI secretion protein, VC_A0111 family n=1 Tax=Janthinobacterium agaricidamnosum NBRC 102515 = DSM 9628 TaxID=1349767 RepID=W0VF60_9BURK|nr:type VI secretion system baseplate subunit TssG [Janthinobacterium agaricidamnosum]CDG85977.1 conserved hypothetical protein [Janthinobacterium agaricidamnosum NBRC 102515 = DSM 9628]
MRDPVALLDSLEATPAAYDFYVALRLLECAHPELPRIGEALRPQHEPVRFGQQPSLAFEGAMLAGLRRAADTDADGRAPRLLVNFFGLLGANGVLPLHLTEYVRDRQRNAGDSTIAHFLDLFQHRMISLFYRGWANAQPALSLDRPGDDRFSARLGALIGIGMASLRERDTVPDFAKLHYAGRMAPHPRNADGLAAILGDFFKLPVRLEQFVGHWMRLPPDGLCRLRSGPQAQVLGQGTLLGTKVWNRQHKFRIVFGPLTLEQAHQMLPGGANMQRLIDWVRNYCGLALDWDVRLVMQREQVPGLRLGRASRLGWTSWVSSAAPAQDDEQLCFTPAKLSAPTTPDHLSDHTFHEGAAYG